MSIPLQRYMRHKIISDPTSPVLNYLKRVPGHTRTYTTKDIAKETEVTGAMSAEDVVHVLGAFIRSLRNILTKGDKVKIDGLGTFHTTFNCEGTEEEKDCTVKSIKRVNVRFAVDNTLRLVNDSNASTRGADNNMEFYIKSDATTANAGTGGNGDDEEEYIDPNA